MFPNIYFGCMSKNVIDSIIDSSNRLGMEIGLIASRRQVDYNGGYVGMTTNELFDYVRKKSDNVYLCRDHAGPMQGINTDTGKTSLKIDSRHMDIIHVDPWKSVSTIDGGINATVDYINLCNSQNSNCKYEIGTEQSIFKYSYMDLEFILNEIERKLPPDIFSNIIMAVIQSGVGLDILKRKNIGEFDLEKTSNFVDICTSMNIMSKEHNADYLGVEKINRLYDAGVIGVNIAPEIAAVESEFIWNYMIEKEYYEYIDKIYQLIVEKTPWKKWMIGNETLPNFQKKDCIIAFSHYIFNDDKFKYMKEKMKIDDLEIVKCINSYIESYVDSVYTSDSPEDFEV